MRKLGFLLIVLYASLVLTGCVPPPEAEAGPMNPKEFIFGSVWFFLMALFVYYLLVLNPSRLRQEDQEKFVGALKKGDEVQTTSGILGRVVSIKPEYITLEIASNTKVKVLPKFVQAIPENNAGDPKAAPKEKGKKGKG